MMARVRITVTREIKQQQRNAQDSDQFIFIGLLICLFGIVVAVWVLAGLGLFLFFGGVLVILVRNY